MTASLSQLERHQVSERTIMALAHKKEMGQHCGSPAYGFEMVDKKLVKVASEHQAILLIQAMKPQGSTLQQIADRLNPKDQGINTKRGAKWQPMQVSRVLNREVV